MIRRTILALPLLLSVAGVSFAQDWAEEMFETTRHDFGNIARGAKEEFRFELTNLYVEDIHLASVRSSCGCTQPRIETPTLKTHETGAIIAKINTDAFQGQRSATVTVTIDKPYWAQVQLHVSAYIRSDVVLHPGSVQLGAVPAGSPAEKEVDVLYAGRSDWRILEVRSDNPHLAGEIKETRRGGGQVGYKLTVYMDEEAPIGYLRDHLLLVTNDSRITQVPVPVEGIIESSISVSPTSLFLGVLQPGQKVTKQLVVRGRAPFRIVAVNCEGGRFEVGTSSEDEAKPLHLIPLTFIAGDEPGKFSGTIHIETDLGEAGPSLSAYAVVSK